MSWQAIKDYMNLDNELEFLKELTLLSRKYKIVIGGCGCCTSPFLAAINKDFSSQCNVGDLPLDGEYVHCDNVGDSEIQWIKKND